MVYSRLDCQSMVALDRTGRHRVQCRSPAADCRVADTDPTQRRRLLSEIHHSTLPILVTILASKLLFRVTLNFIFSKWCYSHFVNYFTAVSHSETANAFRRTCTIHSKLDYGRPTLVLYTANFPNPGSTKFSGEQNSFVYGLVPLLKLLNVL